MSTRQTRAWAKKVVMALAVAAVLIALLLVLRPEPEVWDPFAEVGPAFATADPSAQLYDGYRKESRYIELTDGTRLAADIFLPGSEPAPGERFPTVLQYTAYTYGRAIALPHLAWWERLGLWWQTGRSEAILDQMALSDLARALVARGFAFVAVEMRGVGASFGVHTMAAPVLGADGADVVEWIGRQPWSDGRVGMHGQSYLTWAQLATAARDPDGLRCIVPEAMGLNLYTGLFRPGGIPSQRFLTAFDRWYEALNLNRLEPDGRPAAVFPSAPAADEDGDGRFLDEIPRMAAGDPATFLDDGPPSYPDGEERDDVYVRATREHLGNQRVGRVGALRFADDTLRHEERVTSLATASPVSFLPAVLDAGVPMLVIGGWFDGTVRETLRLYATARSALPAHVIVGPRFHLPPGVPAGYREYLGYRGSLVAEQAAEKIRFYHRCLKAPPGAGVEAATAGGPGTPPVRIHVMNRGWRELSDWPPPGASERRLSLAPEGRLRGEQAVAPPAGTGVDTLPIDFTHSAGYGATGGGRWLLMPPGGPDSLMLRSRKDRAALVWQTEPLDSAVSVVGHPVVELWLGGDRGDADVFLYLSDVGPDGRVVNVTEGRLRTNFHRRVDPGDVTPAGIEVRPALPEHAFRSGDYIDAPLADGPVRLVLDLLPIAWRFRVGHRIRLSLTGADAGNFALHPALCPDGSPSSCVPTDLFVHRDADRPSQLRLPVIPDEE